MHIAQLKPVLDQKVVQYNRIQFIEKDPISIPHRYQTLQDIEIAGFFASILAWGNRTTIINSCTKLFAAMDNAPFDFICNHQPSDLKPLLPFVHRTFNATDLFWLLHFLQYHYSKHQSLEQAFAQFLHPQSPNIADALIGFHRYVFSLPDAPERTRKHIATPERKSACKRLNMFLRWMVRGNNQHDVEKVDFGLWKTIATHQLITPLDVHVGNVARRLGLLQRKQNDWTAAIMLTETLKKLDENDAVKYDFALFGIGIEERVR